MDSITVAIITAVVTILFPAIGGGVVWLYNHRKEDRKDALDEWKAITHNTQEKVEAQQVKIDKQDEINIELRFAIAKCEAEKATQAVAYAHLEGDFRLLTSTVQRLQIKTGDILPPLSSVNIIADMDGVILNVDGAVGPLFNYRPQELIRKNVELLVPDRFKAQHKAAIEKARLNMGSGPWTERILPTYALKSDYATEVPVTVKLIGWQTIKGDWLISAEIRHRIDG